MERPKRESWEEFQDRIGLSLDDWGDDMDAYWASFFYFSSMYCNEQGLNWRRHIVRMKKVLKAIRENEHTS